MESGDATDRFYSISIFERKLMKYILGSERRGHGDKQQNGIRIRPDAKQVAEHEPFAAFHMIPITL